MITPRVEYLRQLDMHRLIPARHGGDDASVRRTGGVCLACFRPALVGNVRKRARYRFTWAGTPQPTIALDGTCP